MWYLSARRTTLLRTIGVVGSSLLKLKRLGNGNRFSHTYRSALHALTDTEKLIEMGLWGRIIAVLPLEARLPSAH